MRSFSGAAGAASTFLAALCCWAGCYDQAPLRVGVQTPGAIADCAQVADAVFQDAFYQRVINVAGPDLFYSPRLTVAAAPHPPTLGWGVGVWIKPRDSSSSAGPCEYELENLQPGPVCSAGQCLYTSQRGADFDQALRSFAQRLAVAAR